MLSKYKQYLKYGLMYQIYFFSIIALTLLNSGLKYMGFFSFLPLTAQPPLLKLSFQLPWSLKQPSCPNLQYNSIFQLFQESGKLALLSTSFLLSPMGQTQLGPPQADLKIMFVAALRRKNLSNFKKYFHPHAFNNYRI